MRRKAGRLALLGTALLMLGVVGAGSVMAASPAPTAPTAAAAVKKAAAGPLVRMVRHVVHGTFIVQKPDGTLQTIQVDRGTIASISGATITISEPSGNQTVATNAQTRVRKDGAKADVSRLAIGDKVLVISTVENGTPVADYILVPRPRPATPPNLTTP